MSNELVRCSALTRNFGPILALDHIDLVLEPGKIIGLLGPNGSGKTTLIKIFNGLLQPTSGSVLIDGKQPGPATKKLISYLPDRGYFPEWMKVGDMIDLFGDFYNDFDRVKAEDMCRALQLDLALPIKTLSKGTKEKMQLMLVMSRKAQLYVLDEPIAGVDPAAKKADKRPGFSSAAMGFPKYIPCDFGIGGVTKDIPGVFHSRLPKNQINCFQRRKTVKKRGRGHDAAFVFRPEEKEVPEKTHTEQTLSGTKRAKAPFL